LRWLKKIREGLRQEELVSWGKERGIFPLLCAFSKHFLNIVYLSKHSLPEHRIFGLDMIFLTRYCLTVDTV